MGDMADAAIDQALDEWLQECDRCGGGPGWHFSPCTEASNPGFLARRPDVPDQRLERERSFGDDLVAYLERRKRLARSSKFFEGWRLTSRS